MLQGLSIIGLVLSVLLMYYHAKRFSSAIYLGAFFFLISLYGFIEYAIFYSKSVTLVAVIFGHFGALPYLTGPMLFWYVRSVLRDDAHLKKKDVLHLIPAFVFLLGSLPYVFSSWTYKVEMAAQIVKDPFYIAQSNIILYDHFIPVYLIYLSRPVLILAYAFYSAGLFYRHVFRGKQKPVKSGYRNLSGWMGILFSFLFILVISRIFLVVHAFSTQSVVFFYTANAFQVLSAIGLTGLLVTPFFFPSILYGMPRLQASVAFAGRQDAKPLHANRSLTNSGPKFQHQYLDQLDEKITACMIKNQPFLNSGFNLSQLAVMTNVPVHHLAIYFREHQKKTFHDFRNEWRIDYAKKMIQNGKASEMTLEAIGQASGFSSRNTFLLSFKKIEGITPQAFRAANHNKISR